MYGKQNVKEKETARNKRGREEKTDAK